jgi:hypothetical protein
VAYGARLESVLGASPRGFESPILRHEEQHDRERTSPPGPVRSRRSETGRALLSDDDAAQSPTLRTTLTPGSPALPQKGGQTCRSGRDLPYAAGTTHPRDGWVVHTQTAGAPS